MSLVKLESWRLAGQETAEFPAVVASVPAVRSFVRGALPGYERLDDAVFCASELAANAVQHSGSERYQVVVSRRKDRVYLAVADSGGGRSIPHVTDVDECTLTGRGLALVSSISSAWGLVRTVHGGWHVWCEFTPWMRR